MYGEIIDYFSAKCNLILDEIFCPSGCATLKKKKMT